jgi:pilus assembly protein CpaF
MGVEGQVGPAAAARTAAPGAPGDREALFVWSLRRFLAPIQEFLDDPAVSEVLVNGHDDVYVEQAGRLRRTGAVFASAEALDSAVANIAQFTGRHLDESTVRIDARLPDGSRVHCVRPPCSRRGTVLAIRKFSRKSFDLARLVELGALTDSAREFLELCVLLRRNILVSGGTGTGKTSFLNALSRAIPEAERILVIEDASELQLQQPHVLPFEARTPDHRGRGAVSIRDLFVSSLRLRPDRIVIGECRGGEALDLLQAMTSGHPGSMSTLHADRPADALRRLETMAMMSAVDLPHAVIRAQVASAIDVVVQLARFADGTRRVIEVANVDGLDDQGRCVLRPLYAFRQEGVDSEGRVRGELRPTGVRPSFAAQLLEHGFGGRIGCSRELWVGPT